MYIEHQSFDSTKTSMYCFFNIDTLPTITTIGNLIGSIRKEYGKYDAITVIQITEDSQIRVRLNTPVDPNGTYRVMGFPFEPIFQEILCKYQEDPTTHFEDVGEKYRAMYWVKKQDHDEEVQEALVKHIEDYLSNDNAQTKMMITELFMALKGVPENMM